MATINEIRIDSSDLLKIGRRYYDRCVNPIKGERTMPSNRICLALCLLLTMFVVAPAQNPPNANYDESKVGSYTLPDPLVMKNGRKVTNQREWEERRKEIFELFATQVYGRTPAIEPRIAIKTISEDPRALGGLATREELTVFLTGRQDGPRMNLLVYLPNRRTGPAPIFLAMNFNGNQSISDEPGIALSTSWMRGDREGRVVNNRATEKSRGSEAARWPLETILSRGYGVATVYYGDLFPDHADGLKDSIIPSFYRAGQTAPAADEWGAIGAWAWGLSRALDVLEKNKGVDSKRVILWGHSRLGKAALWAGAQDRRFAIVISNESGEGGAALARRTFGETVERINTAFPHWFCANFKQYNRRVVDLPVDQHLLIALMAPRPVYIASAAEDLWADPRGEFLGGKGADPVYRLLGKDGLGAAEMPGLHQPVMTTIGYHLRDGKHDVTKYDWEQFMNFADRHVGRPGQAKQ